MTRLPGLDLLRGLAALGVFWFHLSYAASILRPGFPTFEIGACGVQVFFAISGYVILMTALRARDRRAFAWSRFKRLYPAWIACMSLTTAWVLYQGITPLMVSPRDWALNLTMVPQWFGARMVDGVYWSLAYEVAFYAVVCAVLPWIKRGGALWLCLPGLALAWVLPGSYVTSFIVGVTLHEVQRLARPADKAVAELTIVAAITASGQPWIAVMALSLVAAAIRMPLEWHCYRFSAWLGAISYPLYLLHNEIGNSLAFMLAPLGLPAALALAVLSVIGLAAAVHHFVEIPLTRALRRRTMAWWPNAVKQIEFLPVTWPAIKRLKADVDELHAEVEHRRMQ